MENVLDELGRACVSKVAFRPRSNAFRSFAGVQSGILGVSFYESNYGGEVAAKQIPIDDLTSRLRKAGQQHPPRPPPEL